MERLIVPKGGKMDYSKVFKAYDVRGVYPEPLNEEIAEKTARALVQFAKAKRFAVGRDARLSSEKLRKAVCKGASEQGANVDDIGLCTTPMLNFAVANYGFDAGIMVSGSHNPPEYNGLKLVVKDAIQLSGDYGMNEVRKIAEEGKFSDARQGKVEEKNVLDDYVGHVMKFADGIREMKIVVDYSNGVGAVSGKPVFGKLPVEVIPLYEEPDGRFPNHLANPHDAENLKDLQEKVKEEKADLGFFFDGDADRVLLVDEKGSIVFADFVLALLAIKELEKHKNEKICYDLRFSRSARDVISEKGGKPVMLKVGNPLYKEKIIKEHYLMGGEFSGHVMFRENFGIDDGLFAAVKLLAAISSYNKPVSEIINPLKKYNKSEEINIEVKDRNLKMKELEEKYNNSGGKVNKLDGLTIEYDDWWFNIRPSNTEPLLRLNIEAKSKEKFEEMKKKLIDEIKA